jgi:hypothetical protein
MAYHVYDTTYCKVMHHRRMLHTIRGYEGPMYMWRELNDFMRKNSVENPNFKGFMADSAQANWNVV